jgi:ATP-dependent Clp protease ATP-binding subunit ClpA
MSTTEEARNRIAAAIEKKTGYPASRCSVQFNLELEQYEDKLCQDIFDMILQDNARKEVLSHNF